MASSWNSQTYAYMVVELPPTPELTELDAHVFVVRTRIGRRHDL